MPVRRWRGDAPAVSQVTLVTPANVEAGDVFTLTINGKSIAYTAIEAKISDVTAGLAAAWNASSLPEFSEITAGDETTHMTLTANEPGRPFTVSADSTGDGDPANEVQTLEIVEGTPTSGNFTLTFEGQATSNIAWNATAAAVEAALEALASIGAENVSCDGGPLPGAAVTIEFTGALGETDVPLITADNVDLDSGTPVVTETVPGRSGPDTLTAEVSVAGAGPHDWSTAANWSGGAVPAGGDDVVIDAGSVDILYGLDQSDVTLDSLTVTSGYAGSIGLPEINRSGAADYFEYRDTYLKIGNAADENPTTMIIGGGDGPGSGRIKIDAHTGQVTLNVIGSGQPAETGVPAVLFKGTHADNEINVTKGSVGLAVFAGETAVASVLRVGYQTNPAGDAVVRAGAGAALTAVEISGGVLHVASNIGTVEMTGGELIVTAGAITALNLDGGDVRYKSTGTLGTANVGSGGNLDFRQDMRPRTVEVCNLHERFEYHDPFGTVTLSTGWHFIRCTPGDGELDIAPNQTLVQGE